MNEHIRALKESQIRGLEKEIDACLKRAATLTHRVERIRKEVADGGNLETDS